MSLRTSTQALVRSAAVSSSTSGAPAVIPAIARVSQPSIACFSTTSRLDGRKGRDRSRFRGVAPLRRQYPKQPLEMARQPLPKPIMDARKHTPVETDPDHGLWAFFDNKEAMRTPERMAAYGRAWVPAELRMKSFADLHKLWYVCVKERNLIATGRKEWERMKPGYGEREAVDRDRTVRMTMKAIKHVLTERHYAWLEAVQLAEKDPEVNLTGSGPAYVPGNYADAVEEADSEAPTLAQTEEVKQEKAPTATA